MSNTVAIWDIETTGLLPHVDRVHLLVVRKIIDGVRQPTIAFRRNREMDNIVEGIRYLLDSDMIVGHNIIGYDIPVMEKIYPHDFVMQDQIIRDTEVCARMLFADQKPRDFNLVAKGILPGKYIGSNELKAWGYRLGAMKGDYSDDCIAKGINPWAAWSREMEDYAIQDVEVTDALWAKCVGYIQAAKWPEESIRFQHAAHDLMCRQQTSGFGFDVDAAIRYAEKLKAEFDVLSAKAKEHFGIWVAPAKMSKEPPRAHFGEDNTRDRWAEVTVPKRAVRLRDKETGVIEERSPDAPYCAVTIKEFKPTSRHDIVNRLKRNYNWNPTDFTEKGGVKVSDDILRPLAKAWPICEVLADIFFYQKMYGAVHGSDPEAVRNHLSSAEPEPIPQFNTLIDDSDDDDDSEVIEEPVEASVEETPGNWKPAKRQRRSAWLLHYNRETRAIHHRCVIAGAVSGRATHSHPNLGQVKSVQGAEKDDPDGEHIFSGIVRCKKTGGDWKDKTFRVRVGRLGNFGWESRNLFRPLPGYESQGGADLAGIEMRALGARLVPFDGGEFLGEVLKGDPHTKNAIAYGLDPEAKRSLAKRIFYAMIYGAGDEKIGSLVCAAGSTVATMETAGKQLKEAFFKGRPAFKALLNHLARQAKRGYLTGLDGRRLYVRSEHSALNLELQSDAAMIAQKWMLLSEQHLYEADFLWGRDYVQMAYVHDELQFALRDARNGELFGDIVLDAAVEAGEYFQYASPVAAEVKLGSSWAFCH